MADGIQISTQVLLDTAEKVRTINTTLDSKLADMLTLLDELLKHKVVHILLKPVAN